MIIPEQKIFFHHIPKTGGKTVTNFLLDYFNIPLRSLVHFNEGYVMRPSYSDKTNVSFFNICHLPYLDLLEMAQNSKIVIDNSWNIFTLVRNPYFRTASAIFFQPFLECYNHMHTLPTLPEKRKLFKKSYNRFFGVDATGNGYFSHRIPQHILLETETSAPLYKIYKYEEDLENILKKALNLSTLTIPLRNIHSIREVGYPKTDYLSLFTRGYIEKVNEYYCKDFEFCGYEMWDPLGFPEN